MREDEFDGFGVLVFVSLGVDIVVDDSTDRCMVDWGCDGEGPGRCLFSACRGRYNLIHGRADRRVSRS